MAQLVDKSRSAGQMHRVVFAAVLFALVLGNLIIAIALIPVILLVQDFWVYFTVIFAGAAYGALFNYMIRDLEHLETKHHILAAVLVLSTAALSFFMVMKITSFVAPYFAIDKPKEQAITIGLIYIASFLAPYLVEEFASLRKK